MKIKCLLNGIKNFLKYGEFIAHIYKTKIVGKAIIIATKDSFRVSDNFEHSTNEEVFPNAMLIKNKCICCGKEEYNWVRDWDSSLAETIRKNL